MALAELTFLANLAGNKERYQSLYAKLEPEFNDVKAIQFQRIVLNPNSNIAWGRPVPDFEGKLINNDETVTHESMLGRLYLIDFWATWCKPCIAELPHLHHAFEKFKDKNFTIVSMDKSSDKVHEFHKNAWNMPWLHACLNGDWKSEIVQKFEVNNTGKRW